MNGKMMPYEKGLNPATKQEMVSIHFDSMLDLYTLRLTDIGVNSCEADRRFNQCVGNLPRDPGRDTGPSWYGPTNNVAKDVINHALLGDGELYSAKLRPMVDELNQNLGTNTATYIQQVKKAKRIRTKDIYGDELDIHRVYQGQLDKAWDRRKRVESNEKMNLITIVVDIGGLGGDPVVESLWRAAATLKIVSDYEAAGKSIKIIVASAANSVIIGSNAVVAQSITVKNYNERLPLERVAAMCHLGFHRTFSFASRLCHPYGEVAYSFGGSFKLTQRHITAQIRREVEAGITKVIIVPRCTNLMSALSSVRSVYSELDTLRKAG